MTALLFLIIWFLTGILAGIFCWWKSGEEFFFVKDLYQLFILGVLGFITVVIIFCLLLSDLGDKPLFRRKNYDHR